jgi:hypothetical protein
MIYLAFVRHQTSFSLTLESLTQYGTHLLYADVQNYQINLVEVDYQWVFHFVLLVIGAEISGD